VLGTQSAYYACLIRETHRQLPPGAGRLETVRLRPAAAVIAWAVDVSVIPTPPCMFCIENH
jgi:hypothetical protein